MEAEADSYVEIEGSAPSSSSSSWTRARRVVFGAVGAVSVVGACLFLYLGQSSQPEIMSARAYKKLQASSSIMSLSVDSGPSTWTFTRSGYEPLSYFTSDASNTLTYEMFDGYDGIIEPHASMDLYVTDFDMTSSYYFTYDVCNSFGVCESGSLSAKTDETTGVSSFVYENVSMPCAPYSELTTTVTKYNAKGAKKGASTGTLLCIYVRRELRYLTSADLTSTMDAMFTLYSTSEEEGQELYGSAFHNSSYYVAAHHFNAAWRDGDHIHEGLGFLTQHIKITNYFELAMQSVDPSISMPYWDFTIDYAENGAYIFDAYAFKSKTFGSIAKPADKDWGWTYRNDSMADGKIKNGRWKGIKSDYNYNFPDLQSNFGYMRAPWNTNPSPFISRFSGYTTELPACSDHYKWLQYSSFVDFLSNAPYSPHASVHGAIGSVYGCDMMDPLTAAGLIESDTQQNSLCQKWSFMLKELYRKNFISGAESCDYDDLTYEGINCGLVCNEDKYDTMTLQLKSLISSKYVGTLTTEQWEVWRDFVCTGDGAKIFVGDHVESASPADPSFWPIHPTLERLLQAKYMSGGFSDTTWPTDAVNEYVCDKANCYEEVDGELVVDYYDACCYGHYETDQLLDFENADKTAGYGLTNKQVLLDTDPTSKAYGMPYIYDNFDWDHCTEDFSQLLESEASTKSPHNLLWSGDRR